MTSNAARGDVRQRFVGVRRVRHLESAAAKRLLDEPHQGDVVVDIEDADGRLEHPIRHFPEPG